MGQVACFYIEDGPSPYTPVTPRSLSIWPDCYGNSVMPEQERTCWGACGLNRTCEQLEWWHKNHIGHNCANPGSECHPFSSSADLGVCGSGKLGGPLDGKSTRWAGNWKGCWPETSGTGLSGATYGEASQICSDVGARLCTRDEMLDGATLTEGGTCETGRRGNNLRGGTWHWTSTACDGGGVWVVPQGGGDLANMCQRKEGTQFDASLKPSGYQGGGKMQHEGHGVACCSDWTETDKASSG